MIVENAKATANYSPFTQRCIGEAEARSPDVFRVIETSGSCWGNGGQQLRILKGKRYPSHLIGRHSSRPYQSVAFDGKHGRADDVKLLAAAKARGGGVNRGWRQAHRVTGG